MARQTRSDKNGGTRMWIELKVRRSIFVYDPFVMFRQWSCCSKGVMCWMDRVCVMILAAEL